jgi:hypothetical protein
MSTFDRSVLVLGDESMHVERLVPVLRRASLSVRKLVRPDASFRVADEPPDDLLAVVMPFERAVARLGDLRGERSPWRQTAVLVLVDRASPQRADPGLISLANRVLPLSSSDREVQQAVLDLLRVAPRVAVRATLRARLASSPDDTKTFRVDNVSSAGMLLRTREPMPVGTVFGFALDLESESEPVRGQAEVVRLVPFESSGEVGLGVRIRSCGGDGRARLALLAGDPSDGTRPRRGATATGAMLTPAEALTRAAEELAEIEPILDERLTSGLTRRLGSADWYLTGVELGLESLHAFSSILEIVHGGRAAGWESASRLADLAEVRTKLAEFAQPHQDLGLRVEILVGARRAIERVLRELADSGAVASGDATRARKAGVVAQVAVDAKRLVSSKKSLRAIRALLVDLDATRYLFARGARRRVAERICRDYRSQLAVIGFGTPERLLARKDRRAAVAAVDRELRALDQRLATLHERVFGRKFRQHASGDVEADLAQPVLESILADILSAGREYLERAYSAYRHALELSGDTAILERAGSLAATIRLAMASGALPVPATAAARCHPS